jgi:intein/homing endonuclease
MGEKSDWEKSEQANRDAAQQRLNMGGDPGGYFADLKGKYDQKQAAEKAQKERYTNKDTGCFPAGSLVDTPHGPRRIEELRPDDIVLSFDSSSHRLVEEQVLARKEHPANRILTISFRDCSSLRTTKKHSFLVEGRWKKAADLRQGDRISQLSQGVIAAKTVDGIKLSDDVETVYNLTTSGPHNFLVFGFVAHNFTYFRHVRVAYWRLRMWLAVAEWTLKRRRMSTLRV